MHLRSGDSRGRDLSGHRKKQTEQGVLTPCRRQVGTCQDTERNRPSERTHKLKKVEGRTCQDTERTDRAWRTHSLEIAEGGTCQDTERNRQSEAHSLPGESRGRGMSGYGKKPTKREAHTSWRRQRKGRLVRTQKKPNQQGALTNWRRQREEGLVRTPKTQTEQGALTFWRRQKEELVRTRQEIHRARHAHFLETAKGETCQDTERNRLSQVHSRPGDGRRRDLSGHRKKLTEQGTLTN